MFPALTSPPVVTPTSPHRHPSQVSHLWSDAATKSAGRPAGHTCLRKPICHQFFWRHSLPMICDRYHQHACVSRNPAYVWQRAIFSRLIAQQYIMTPTKYRLKMRDTRTFRGKNLQLCYAAIQCNQTDVEAIIITGDLQSNRLAASTADVSNGRIVTIPNI